MDNTENIFKSININAIKQISINCIVWLFATLVVFVFLYFKSDFGMVDISEKEINKLIDIKLVFSLIISCVVLSGIFGFVNTRRDKKDEEFQEFLAEELASITINLGSLILVSQLLIFMVLLVDSNLKNFNLIYVLVGFICYVLGYFIKKP